MRETVVYADLLFLIDFSMDLLTFFIVSRIMRVRPSLLRMISASAMGGVYSVASLPMSGGILSFVFGVFVCFVMCMTAFLSKKWENFAKMAVYTAMFFTVSLLLGGVMTAFYSMLNRTPLLLDADKEDLSLWVFAIGALASGAATLMGGRLMSRLSRAKQGKLKISFGGKNGIFSGLSDSGNLLRDPINGKAVIVIDRGKACTAFPGLCCESAAALPHELIRKIRVIPVKTPSGTGLLTAFRPDSISLIYDGEEKRIDALVALSREEISGSGSDAVIPAEFFT